MSHVECMIMTMQLSKEPNNCIQKDTTVNCVLFPANQDLLPGYLFYFHSIVGQF